MRYPFGLPEGPAVAELGRVKSKAACDKLAAKLLSEGYSVVYAFAEVIVNTRDDWQYGYIIRAGIPLNGKLPDVIYNGSWAGGQAF